MLIGGFDYDGTPRLFKTEPSGTYYEYMANSTGRGEKPVREYLEEHYNDENTKDEAAVLKLVIKALSQVVQSGAQNIEIAVMKASPSLVRAPSFFLITLLLFAAVALFASRVARGGGRESPEGSGKRTRRRGGRRSGRQKEVSSLFVSFVRSCSFPDLNKR